MPRFLAPLVAALCLFAPVSHAQQPTQCATIEAFSAAMASQEAFVAVSMKDADGDKREVWVRPDGHWMTVWYPSQGGGRAVCLDAMGSDFETHLTRKPGRAS